MRQISHWLESAASIAGMAMLGVSVYWSATTYGAFTVVQILGPRDAGRWFDRCSMGDLLLGLPCIPLALLSCRRISLHNQLVEFVTMSSPVEEVEEDEESALQCRICLQYEEEDVESVLISPCACKGTNKWVHQSCINTWIDLKQDRNMDTVECSLCRHNYCIIYPKSEVMRQISHWLESAASIAGMAMLGVSVYWSATTYGAFTVVQILGPRDAGRWFDRCSMGDLLLGLPCIPLALLSCRRISLHNQLVEFVTMSSPVEEVEEDEESALYSMLGSFSSALFFPTISIYLGRLMFSGDALRQTILVGLSVFIFREDLPLL
ncbi:E3 ubiquitin-protein ligase MARCHF5-like [Octopus sinensis]|uniref:E3 ubiquitin-protein ligase MARCHF5 n=1 Tax=Octopus sinensis TaxID=2607531 RepID=A0A7E6EH16_9MOLL|nr:E3 ubiquitin-protein ligase MARCHF5-like [Octopus sinensis]